MGATYTIADYMGLFLGYTLGSALLVGVLGVFAIRKLAKRRKQFWLVFAPMVGYAVFLCLLCLHAMPVLKQTGDLLIPSEYERKTTAGEIICVTPAEHVPLYCVNGALCGADRIEIGEASYYVISEGLLTEGMLVELEYAQFENNVVLSWQEVSADRVASVLQEQRNSAPTEMEAPPQKEIPQEMQKLSYALIGFGFCSFLAFIAVTGMLRQRIVDYLFVKDGAVRGQIIPNPKAALFAMLPGLFISMIIVGASIGSGEYSVLLILAVGGGAMATILLVEQLTSLQLDGQYILIKRLRKEKQYTMADLRSVTWRSCRGWIGKQLIVMFNDGKSYWFDMDHYMGVQNTYNDLKKHLSQGAKISEK